MLFATNSTLLTALPWLALTSSEDPAHISGQSNAVTITGGTTMDLSISATVCAAAGQHRHWKFGDGRDRKLSDAGTSGSS
ncbi:hypothetical protein VD0004_g5848 [Verticillium dahliae]|nr:hypothetical protein VD0004_g5848 [Verticillium dahliae]PNH64635.1 hypothetical protein VD0001_g8761 [Verticillium dahliae]